VTWRLYGTSPRNASDPLWLSKPEVATAVRDVVYSAAAFGLFDLHASVVMPNHVHLLISPGAPLPRITGSLKRRSARVANQILERTRLPFWQPESFDHWVRNRDEQEALVTYIESNPVKAGLVRSPQEWPWSSATVAQD